jgi:iron only hydrogenase large subunit-like protein
VDASFTTRELAAMLKRSCVSRFTVLKVWRELPDEEFDAFPGMVSGSSVYTGGSGVTENEYGQPSGVGLVNLQFIV